MINRHVGGRPPKFENPEQMQEAINKYFDSCWVERNDESSFEPTMTGLARSLGLSRQGLCNYKEKDGFVDTIKEARDVVAEALEGKLYGSAVTGVIFNLKNNFGYKDKIEQELTAPEGPIAGGNVVVEFVTSESPNSRKV